MSFIVSGSPASPADSGENFQTLVNRLNRIDVELSLSHGVDNIRSQNEVSHVCSRDHDALPTGKPLDPADIVETLDFFIHTPYGLHFSPLIY